MHAKKRGELENMFKLSNQTMEKINRYVRGIKDENVKSAMREMLKEAIRTNT